MIIFASFRLVHMEVFKKVCHYFSTELYKRARLIGDWVSILATIGKTTANGSIYRGIEGEILKTLTTSTASVSIVTEMVHRKYTWNFHSSINPSVSFYNEVHKDGHGLNITHAED